MSSFGLGQAEKLGKNEELKDMVSNLVGYPKAPEVEGITPIDTPLAPLSVPQRQAVWYGLCIANEKIKKVIFLKESLILSTISLRLERELAKLSLRK